MTTKPKKFGVMGWPVEHSLSPPMQQAAFDACGVEAEYCLLPTRPEQVQTRIRELREQGFAGWNVTVPHKPAVGKCMDRLVAEADLLGSVNTVVVEPDRTLTGHSTDGYGLEAALRERFAFAPAGGRLAFVGGGGAVAATAVHLARRGVAEIALINRTLARIQLIAALIARVAPDCRVHCLPADDRETIAGRLSDLPLLIQATSLGLRPNDPLPLPVETIPRSMAVMDMIYGQTRFLAALRDQGCETADGQAMLLHQGARSFFLWTGIEPPLEIMRQALRDALRLRRPDPER